MDLHRLNLPTPNDEAFPKKHNIIDSLVAELGIKGHKIKNVEGFRWMRTVALRAIMEKNTIGD